MCDVVNKVRRKFGNDICACAIIWRVSDIIGNRVTPIIGSCRIININIQVVAHVVLYGLVLKCFFEQVALVLFVSFFCDFFLSFRHRVAII